MNLDFRKLSMSDQRKAINNLMKIEGDSPNYITHLFANSQYDVYSWFRFQDTVEGVDYWINLKEKEDEKV